MTPTGSTHRLPIRGRQLDEYARVLTDVSWLGGAVRVTHRAGSDQQRRSNTCEIVISHTVGGETTQTVIGPRGGVRPA